MAEAYRIRFDGRLSEEGREAFCDMKIVDIPHSTVLVGEVIDQAHLHGVIAQLQAMGIAITSVHRV